MVVVILTRPDPRPLLWACYLGSLSVSVGGGIVIFAIFRSRGTIAGASSHRLSPATYLVVGVVAVAIAIFTGSRRGRQLIRRGLPVFPRPKRSMTRRSAAVSQIKSRADSSLREGSLVVAALVGALLAVPGPFDLLALGHLARGGYRALAAGAIIVAFALIKFLLIELPIASYVADPDGTAVRVERFSVWMQANKISVLAAVVWVIGLVLIGRGLAALG